MLLYYSFNLSIRCEGYDSRRGTSWLSFMKLLTESLTEDEDWSLQHVRIGINPSFIYLLHLILILILQFLFLFYLLVRYEDFQTRPIELCRRLYHFLFLEDRPAAFKDLITNHSSPYFWTDEDINGLCDSLFPAALKQTTSTKRKLRSTSTSTSTVQQKNKKNENSHSTHQHKQQKQTMASIFKKMMNQNNNHRELSKGRPNRQKLVGGKDYHNRKSLNYNPSFINATCGFSMSQFRLAYHLFDEESVSTLESLSSKISPYGYSLDPYNYYTQTDLLAKWNLMKP